MAGFALSLIPYEPPYCPLLSKVDVLAFVHRLQPSVDKRRISRREDVSSSSTEIELLLLFLEDFVLKKKMRMQKTLQQLQK